MKERRKNRKYACWKHHLVMKVKVMADRLEEKIDSVKEKYPDRKSIPGDVVRELSRDSYMLEREVYLLKAKNIWKPVYKISRMRS